MPTSLYQQHRLHKHADYQRVYGAARRQFSKQIAYFYALRPAVVVGEEAAAVQRPALAPVAPGPRVGLTVPKAMAKLAHDRNRIKRRMREAVRAALPALQADVDVVLHPRRSVATMEMAALVAEVRGIFEQVERGVAKTARAKADAAREKPNTAGETPAATRGNQTAAANVQTSEGDRRG